MMVWGWSGDDGYDGDDDDGDDGDVDDDKFWKTWFLQLIAVSSHSWGTKSQKIKIMPFRQFWWGNSKFLNDENQNDSHASNADMICQTIEARHPAVGLPIITLLLQLFFNWPKKNCNATTEPFLLKASDIDIIVTLPVPGSQVLPKGTARCFSFQGHRGRTEIDGITFIIYHWISSLYSVNLDFIKIAALLNWSVLKCIVCLLNNNKPITINNDKTIKWTTTNQ